MASTTTTIPFSSLCTPLIKLPQNQTPITFNLPLSRPTSIFLSPPISHHQKPFSLFSVAVLNGGKLIEDFKSEDELPEWRKNAFARPKIEDVFPQEIQDIDIPEPGTPEYEAALAAIIPKKPPPPPREEIFAVVMVGSRQYIVIPGRWIYTQRLKGANVNDKIILNKVLLVGTKTNTYVGKPIVTNAAVHAVVEDQLLDDKVMVFKYKKKKNYRRTIGHRQPITRIKITGITGYEDYPATALEELEAEPATVSS